MPNHKNKIQLRKIKGALIAFVTILSGLTASAFSPEFYTSSSALSKGNWAKIEVKESGMQFVSDATMASLGFSNPEAVNVYGYGGRMIPENLDSPDDLPLVPSIRVNGGIIFFGHGNVTWTLTGNSQALYSHTGHAYSDNSYYFLSDIEGKRVTPDVEEASAPAGSPVITEFIERLVHEQDLAPAMTTGRLMLGEDFKTTSSRAFSFNLPDNKGDALVTTAFGCKTSGGTSSLVFTANGKQLSGSETDKMAYSDSKMIVTTKTVKEVSNPGTALDLAIKFNGSGNVSKAALDYIEVEYPRALNLNGGELYFYLKPEASSTVNISGATSATRLWDVTDPVTPKEIKATLNGTTLSFTTPAEYREYVAFDSSRITRAAEGIGRIDNQDIHSMESPEMLVISPAEYIEAAYRLVNLHERTDGLRVAVLTPEEIYNEFSSGKPDVSAFRKLLKMWYDRAGGQEGYYAGYCLIMSRPTYDNKALTSVVRNAGYPRVPIWQSPTGETATTSYSTDDYIGMLADVKGTFSIGTAQIHASVGRMPVKNITEANTAIEKLEKYITSPDYGSWRNSVVVIADDQDSGVHLDQAEKVVEALKGQGNGNDFLYEKLYLDSYPLEYTGVGAAYPAASERLQNKLAEGIAYLDYIGHANPTSWGHEYLLTWNDITKMNNTRLPFIYAATCEFMRWDDDEVSGAEVMWLYPDAGVIGMICPSREVLISANGVLNRASAEFVFSRDKDGLPIRFGDIMKNGKNTSNTNTNKLRYGLIGDPSMRMPWPVLSVKVDAIEGTPITEEMADFPTLKARASAEISGHVEDSDGNLIEDFNGIAEIQLYDAEKVITTNANGSDGVESIYNDRKVRLYKGRVKVVDGKWSTIVNMPAEIENNYSPALVSLYAWDEQGREANGSCESLYVYGYDTTAPDDFEGPKIEEFYLNTPSFENGQEVAPSPVVYVRFSDESGISVSEAGIGHGITLELDGTRYYEDVAQYYIPDENDPTAGSVTYRLSDVGQGKHTLRFIVWDNANNSTTAELDFNISALWKPSIEKLTTDVNPATTSVNFIVATDASTDAMSCQIEVFDINGRRVWTGTAPSFKVSNSSVTLGWNLTDFGGARVNPGIYLYRATVTTGTGAKVTRTRKLIVS